MNGLGHACAMRDITILGIGALVCEQMTEGSMVHKGKGLQCVTHELNMSTCYINDMFFLTWSSTTTNSTICSINPSFDHWGTFATVQSSRVFCSHSFPPPAASVMALMIRGFGLTPFFLHPAK
jgi:hypothetical protein